MFNPTTIVNAVIATITFSMIDSNGNERRYELTQRTGLKMELYVEYSDTPGLMQFVAYLSDVQNVPAFARRGLDDALWALDDARRAYVRECNEASERAAIAWRMKNAQQLGLSL